MNRNPKGSILNNININTNYRKKTFLTLTIIGSLVFSLILSPSIMTVDMTGSVLVFAQQNETETKNDLQKQSDSIDLQKQSDSIDETSNNNDEQKTAVGTIIDTPPPIDNCGINPNAPPCCTPGQDEGCTNPNVDEITISNFNTIPQKINSQDEFEVQVTVTNNLNMPITYRGDMCGGSPLDIQFDKNVNVYNAIACQAISAETLNANESATVEGKGYEILRAMGLGNVNTKITFNYEVLNGDAEEKQATKSFSFTIE
ncbi:MAG TPA: hypothetical protein VFT71_04900 [Candidatus Nitrosocosmicus sp.]|nr:hypothetical protein [Candidatus Nitrosocosmicus sp.]